MTTRLPRCRGLRLFPALLYMGLIFYFSSLPGPELPVDDEADDRLLHFIAYFGLGLMLLYAATAVWAAPVTLPHFLAAAVIGVLYGASDEWHQSFVPQRDASVKDLAFDAAGVGAALAVAALVAARLRRS